MNMTASFIPNTSRVENACKILTAAQPISVNDFGRTSTTKQEEQLSGVIESLLHYCEFTEIDFSKCLALAVVATERKS